MNQILYCFFCFSCKFSSYPASCNYYIILTVYLMTKLGETLHARERHYCVRRIVVTGDSTFVMHDYTQTIHLVEFHYCIFMAQQ